MALWVAINRPLGSGQHMFTFKIKKLELAVLVIIIAAKEEIGLV